jgi:hypothetical protein
MAVSNSGKVKGSKSSARGSVLTCPFSISCPDTPATLQGAALAVKLFWQPGMPAHNFFLVVIGCNFFEKPLEKGFLAVFGGIECFISIPEGCQPLAGGGARHEHYPRTPNGLVSTPVRGRRHFIPEKARSQDWHPFRMRHSLRLLSGGIAALDHRLIAPNPSGSGETISITRSWRVGRGFVNCRATPSLRNLLAGIRRPRSIPSKTAKNPKS